jgi:xylulokinase
MIDYPEDIDPFYSHNYQIGCFQVKNKYAVLNFVNSAGSIIEWYSRNIGNARESRCRNRKRPQESGPSRNSLIVLPHFLGSGTPWLDEYSRGIILGLDLRTRREDIYLAILEGIVFELRTNLELFESISNRRYKIRAAGGGSASRAWMQIRSNILGRAITEIEDKEAGCLAGAMFSLVHRGVFRDIESAAKELVRVKRTYYPDSRSRQYYREKYGIFAEVYGNNRRSLRSISQLRWG